MRGFYQVQQIYDAQIKDVTTSPDKWMDMLKMAGQLYRFEFDNILLIYGQKPRATLVADYDTWKKVDRFVKRGSKGIAIFPSRALDPHMRCVFDISDTGGQKRKLTWYLDGDTLKEYLDFLVSEGQMEPYQGTDRESLKNSLKSFTGTNVWAIIKEEFSDRLNELLQLSGSGITEYVQDESSVQPKRKSLSDMEQLLYDSILYAVGTRCGFDLSSEERDFSRIVNISNEEVIYRLGTLVCDVSCSVLRDINSNLKSMEQQKKLSAEGRNQYGRDGITVHGSGRTALSEHSGSGRADKGDGEVREVRTDGDGVSEGGRASEVQNIVPFRETGGDNERGGEGSKRASGHTDGTVSGEAQSNESVIHNGDVEDKGAGEDAGRGSGTPSDSEQISLEDEELNRELDELNSFGKSEEAGQFRQVSFFDAEFGLSNAGSTPTVKKTGEHSYEYRGQKYTYLEPKKEPVVPHGFIKEVVLRGTGFVGGRGRVCEIFNTEIDAGTRAKRIKKE